MIFELCVNTGCWKEKVTLESDMSVGELGVDTEGCIILQGC